MSAYMFNLYMDTYCFLVYNYGRIEGGVPLEKKKVSQAQRRATQKYLEGFEDIRTRVPKGEKDAIKAHAESLGESLNAFMLRAVRETMERDNATPTPSCEPSEGD